MKKLPLRTQMLCAVLPMVFSMIFLVYLMRTFVTQTADGLITTLYDDVYYANTNLINGERDFYQSNAADLKMHADRSVIADQMGAYEANYKQAYDNPMKAVEVMKKYPEVYNGYTVQFLAQQIGLDPADDGDGYLQDTRTFAELEAAYYSELDAWYNSYNPETQSGDWAARNQHFATAGENLNFMKDFIDMYGQYKLSTIEKAIDSSLLITLIITIVVLVAVIIFGTLVIEGIMRGVRTTKKNIDELAGKNLTYEPQKLDGTNEMAQMTKASYDLSVTLKDILESINSASIRINDVSNKLNESSHDVAKTSDEISTAINEISEKMSSQASETGEASEQTKILGDIVIASNEAAETLANVSRDIGKATNDGMEVVTQLQRDTETNNQAFQRIFDAIDAMTESASKIGETSQLISDIASQTNLLSLNASIEAARAGEMGKGFAVVADEIRTLASQSADAVNTIDSMLAELRSCVDQASEQRVQVQEAVKTQAESVQATGEKYKLIVEKVDEINKEVSSLDELSNNMDKSCKVVVEAVNNLSSSATDCAASSEETSASASAVKQSMTDMTNISDDVRALSEELRDLLKGFNM
jgi:methyl-accepting chemotaxis protein